MIIPAFASHQCLNVGLIVTPLVKLPFYSHANRAKSLHSVELRISRREFSFCEYAFTLYATVYEANMHRKHSTYFFSM